MMSITEETESIENRGTSRPCTFCVEKHSIGLCYATRTFQRAINNTASKRQSLGRMRMCIVGDVKKATYMVENHLL